MYLMLWNDADGPQKLKVVCGYLEKTCHAFMFSPFPLVFSKVLMCLCKVLKVNKVWAWNASSVVPVSLVCIINS